MPDRSVRLGDLGLCQLTDYIKPRRKIKDMALLGITTCLWSGSDRIQQTSLSHPVNKMSDTDDRERKKNILDSKTVK